MKEPQCDRSTCPAQETPMCVGVATLHFYLLPRIGLPRKNKPSLCDYIPLSIKGPHHGCTVPPSKRHRTGTKATPPDGDQVGLLMPMPSAAPEGAGGNTPIARQCGKPLTLQVRLSASAKPTISISQNVLEFDSTAFPPAINKAISAALLRPGAAAALVWC